MILPAAASGHGGNEQREQCALDGYVLKGELKEEQHWERCPLLRGQRNLRRNLMKGVHNVTSSYWELQETRQLCSTVQHWEPDGNWLHMICRPAGVRYAPARTASEQIATAH